jgi:hypothetical protein
MERQAYFEFVSKYNRQNYQNKTADTQTQVGDTQLNQNSATVSHVNRDNFKLNAVYDVKIDTVNTLKITKTNFTLTVMSLRWYHWQRWLLRNKQERLFTTNSDKAALSASVCLNINLLNPQNISINSSWNTLNTSQ